MRNAIRGKLPKNAVQPGMRLIVYVRVSSVGDRGEDLISDDVQEDVCRRWGAVNGVEIIEVVPDLDATGREFAKRKIMQIIERINRAEADGVLVWKISRFGRNTLDSLLNIRRLQEMGGRIASATENLDDIETAMGKFSLTQMLAIAQLQSDQIGETWQNIHAYRRSLGLPHSGGPRFGYDYHEDAKDPAKVYTPNPVTGPWLAKCFRGYVAGRSVASMVTELWDNGIRSVRGNRIVYRSLMASMDSGFGAGLLVDKSTAMDRSGSPHTWIFTEGAHEAVIKPEVWDAYVSRRTDPRAPREKAPVHKLSGLPHCGTCKRKDRIVWKERPSDKSKYRAFHCAFTNKVNTTTLCLQPSSISQERLEAVVLAWLIEQSAGNGAVDAAIARKAAATRARADSQALDTEISKLSKRLSRATDRALDEDDDDARQAFREKATEIRTEINALKEQRADLAEDMNVAEIPMQTAFSAVTAMWEHGDLGVLNEALRKLIARVEINPLGQEPRVRIIPRWEAA